MFIKSFSHSLKASKHIFAVYVDMEQICINLINLKVPICLFILLKRCEWLSVNDTLLSSWYLICVSFYYKKKDQITTPSHKVSVYGSQQIASPIKDRFIASWLHHLVTSFSDQKQVRKQVLSCIGSRSKPVFIVLRSFSGIFCVYILRKIYLVRYSCNFITSLMQKI